MTPKKMKVVLLTDSDVFFGTERHILDLARGLHDNDVDVMICCPESSPLAQQAERKKIGVIPIEKNGAIDMPAILTLYRLLKRDRVDIIHAHNGRTAFLASIAVKIARKGKLVLTQHFIAPAHTLHGFPKSVVHRWAHKWLNRNISLFIAISESVRSAMLERRDASTEKIFLIPNGASTPDMASITDPEVIRRDLGLGKGDALVLCASRLQPEKNVAALIRAMPEVLEACPQARCVIAGDGCQKNELFAMIKELKLDAHVKMIGFYKDILALMNAADLFVLPSAEEPFGLVLLEAMALSRPVIAICAGGPAEIVVDRKTGLLVNAAEPHDIAGAILTILENPGLGREMGKKGFKRFREKYTIEEMSKKTLNAYMGSLHMHEIDSARSI